MHIFSDKPSSTKRGGAANDNAINAETLAFKQKMAETAHVPGLSRGLEKFGIFSLDQKALFISNLISRQNKLSTFPYERYLESPHDQYAKVHTPGENRIQDCITWNSNLYLGLHQNQSVLNAIQKNLPVLSTGCGTSAAGGGFTTLHRKLESELAKHIGKEAAVLFPTGYTTNVGALSALASNGDFIIFDRECHSCIIDGIILSGAEYRSFSHNNIQDLERKLKYAQSKKTNNIFVVIESVYSFSGEEAPLKDIVQLKNVYPFYLYVDEAHAYGIYGDTAIGLSEQENVLDDVDFFMSTLSKSAAGIGGFLACSEVYSHFIRAASNQYLFQAVIPPLNICGLLESLSILRTDTSLKKRVWDNTSYFRQELLKMGFNLGKSSSPIIPIYIQDEALLITFGKALFDHNIFVVWACYPAVKKGTGRLRFTTTALHNKNQIDKTLEVLFKFGKQLKII